VSGPVSLIDVVVVAHLEVHPAAQSKFGKAATSARNHWPRIDFFAHLNHFVSQLKLLDQCRKRWIQDDARVTKSMPIFRGC
jgi:hypothetical protein